MMIFSEDMEIARSSLAMITSYSASLLGEVKFKCMAYSMISQVGALSYKPKPAPVYREAPSTFRVHQPKLFGSISC